MEPSSQHSPPVDVHEPFSCAERMQQLADIDRDIASALELTGKAIQSLGKQNVSRVPNNNNDPSADASQDKQHPGHLSAEEQTEAFRDSMDKFLSTLHSIDVRVKRQILGLEEAGIITLPAKETKDKTKEEENPGPKPVLEPNGIGMVGNLDVGWLNSRSNQVEREMEAELWTKARTHLERLAGSAGAGSGGGDASMTG